MALFKPRHHENGLEEMIHRQLQARGIRNGAILDAFRQIPREWFMPRGAEMDAYGDYPSQIGCGQTISQPYVVALMLEYLEISTDHRVLEIGTGSGYTTALLSALAREVHSVEVFEELLALADANLERVDRGNIHLYLGSGWEALPGNPQFDRIIAWASPPAIPPALLGMLALEGRMVLPVGKLDQTVVSIRKRKQGVETQQLDLVRFVPLIREDKVPRLIKQGRERKSE